MHHNTCDAGDTGAFQPVRTEVRRNTDLPVVDVCVATSPSAIAKEEHMWKTIAQFTELLMEAGETWQRADKLHQWLDSILLGRGGGHTAPWATTSLLCIISVLLAES